MVSIEIPKRPVFVSLKSAEAGLESFQSSPHEIVLESSGYTIRNVRPSDINEGWLSLLNDEAVLRGLNISGLNFDMPKLRKFLAGFDNHNNYFLGIFDNDDNEFVGFYTIDVHHLHRTASFTTGVNTQHERGKKTLWATNDVVLDYFYAHTKVEKFSARVLARNYAMIFNFKGSPRFFYEGCLRDECRAPDGSRVDILVFSSFKTLPAQYRST